MEAVVTGVGALSPLGLDLESFWKALLEEQSCIQSGLGVFNSNHWDEINKKFNFKTDAGKVSKLAYLAAQEAMKKASWTNLTEEDGLILGTTTGEIISWEAALLESYKKNDFKGFFDQGGFRTPGRALQELCSLLNFTGKSMMVVSACSASTQAVGMAAEWVKSGRVKRCLVGGAEVLTQLSVEGFKSLGLLSPDRAKPFDAARSGINLSEAAAFFCVEKATQKNKAVAVIKSFATNSDAHHLTAPHPEGAGTVGVFQEALRKAKISANQVDWIHAHGTASPSNDKAEGAAIHKIFPGVSVSSTKAYHGHSLGAAGALETAICIQSLKQQLKIKSLGCETLDPALHINVQKNHEKASLKYIVKNSLGFGGVNAAIVLADPSTLGDV